MWGEITNFLSGCIPLEAHESIQTLMWSWVSNHDRIAWGIVAFIALIGGCFQLRMLMASKVDALGFSRLLILLAQGCAFGTYWQSGFLWYAVILYTTGATAAAILQRVDWCHLKGTFMERLGKAYYVLRHFEQVHPIATGHKIEALGGN